MTSQGLERALHTLNGSNGHDHVVVWVDGQEHDVVEVERDGDHVRVVAGKGRTMEEQVVFVNGRVDEQSIPARRRML